VCNGAGASGRPSAASGAVDWGRRETEKVRRLDTVEGWRRRAGLRLREASSSTRVSGFSMERKKKR